MHRDPDFLPARGVQMARLAIATAAGATFEDRLDFASARWGSRSTVVQMIKADVSGHEAADSTANVAGTFEQAAEFGEMVDSQGLLKSGLSLVPANTPFLAAVTDPAANWINQSKGVPVSRAVLDRTTMQAKKIGSLIVLTDELIRSADPRVELMVLSMMLRSARLAADTALASPSNTGDAATPAAVTSAATPINSTDIIANDALAGRLPPLEDRSRLPSGGCRQDWLHRLVCVPAPMAQVLAWVHLVARWLACPHTPVPAYLRAR